MRVLVGCLSIIPVLSWLFININRKDITAPVNVYTLLYIINIMIPVIIYSTNSGSAALGNEYLKVAVRNDNVFYLYVLLQVISYFLVIIGTRIHLFVGIRKKRKNIDTNLNIQGNTQRGYFIWGCLFWMVGFFAFLMIMRRVGGIYYFFTHLQFRRSLTSNIDFWSWLLPFINYGCLLIVYSLKGSSKKMGLPLIGLLVVSGLISGLGGRKALIILLLEAILIYHYTVKKIELKKFIHLKYILGVILLYVFFILMSNFRTQGAFETFLSEPISFIKQSNGGIFDTLRKESYVPFFIAVLYYFKSHDFWFGRSFLGLITAPIPSSLYAGKPPVDDGAYLYSICSGRTEITPPMPYSSLDGSSYPLETFGSMYGNFGIVGLLLGMLLLGIIIGSAYRYMCNNNYSFFSIILYTQVIMTFELSTLRIFQLFGTIVMLGLITFVVRKVKLKKI